MKKENIVIFGIGIAGRAIYRQIKDTHNVVGFIDNNESIDNTKYDNVLIYSLKKLCTLSFDKIAISGVWIDSMIKQLNTMGINNDKILLIEDNSVDFSSINRVETTDLIVKTISDICKKENMNSYVIGSSLATLFRNKDLSCVADVDLFLCSQQDADLFYQKVISEKQFKDFEITKVLYEQDEVLAKKNDIKKIVISSIVKKEKEEASIIDISIADVLNENYMVRHDKNYIYVPIELCEGQRYYPYKDIHIQIPFLAEEYLALLYGKNWIIPPKKWDQSDYGNLLTPEEVQNIKENNNA